MPLTAGHLEIQQHPSTGAPAPAGRAPRAAVGVGDAEAFALEHRLAEAPLRRIVVDDEHRLVHLKTPTNKCARHRRRVILCLPDTGGGKGGVSEYLSVRLTPSLSARVRLADDFALKPTHVTPPFKPPADALPQWRLDDLYAGREDPRIELDLDAAARINGELAALKGAFRRREARPANAGRADRSRRGLYQAATDKLWASAPMPA